MVGCKKAPSTGGCSDVTGIDPEYETKAVGEETPDCFCCWAGKMRSASVHNRTRKVRGRKGGKKQNGTWKRICQLASLSARLDRTDSFFLSYSFCLFFLSSLSLFLSSPLPSPKTVQASDFSLLLARSLSAYLSTHTIFCSLLLAGFIILRSFWSTWWFRASSDNLPLGILKHWGGAVYWGSFFSNVFLVFYSGISSSRCLSWKNDSAIPAAEQLYNTKLSF